MEALSPFHQGVDRDTAPDLVQGHARDLRNFRLTSMEGKGLILVNVRGNELQFSLNDGFIPLGYVTYKGVSFIFSFNPDTLEGEVGTYPSPLLNCNGGYEHVYRALQNWNGIVDPRIGPINRTNFRTTLFNFDCTRQLEVQARISWDNSVELFFADWRNPFRHINTGFDIDTGICSNRIYWTGSFPTQVDVFFETCKHPFATNVSLDSGGALQAGNWFFYYRYKTIDFNATSFLGETGPVQITTDGIPAGVTLDGDPALTDTGRSVVIDLANIDPNFPYLEVAFTYHHGDTFETGLVNVLYPIPPGATTMQITITGTEEMVDITPADILNKKPAADSPRSISQQENRMFGANWREQFAEFQQMADVAALVQIKPPDPPELLSLPDGNFTSGSNPPFQYKDYTNTLENLGYFRGEPYAFAVVFVYSSGKESLPYPMRGYDAWFDPGAAVPNNKGILRFPANYQAGYSFYDVDPAENVRVMGVKFDTSAAPLTAWMQANICGFYFVRGERKPQLVYQGAVGRAWVPGAQVQINGAVAVACGPGPPNQEITSSWIPDIVRRDLNFMTAPDRQHLCSPSDTLLGHVQLDPVSKKHALFSTDHFFKRTLSDGLHTTVLQGHARLSILSMSSSVGLPDHMLQWSAFFPVAALSKTTPYCYNVQGRSYNVVGGGFTSRFAEAGTDPGLAGLPTMFYFFKNCLGGCTEEYGNRDMAQRPYVAMSYIEPGADDINEGPLIDDGSINPNGVAVVNLYRSDPEFVDITTLYDPPSTQYKRISDVIPIASWNTIGTTIFFHGDCFLQRTYHKHLHDTGYHDSTESENGRLYVFGTIVGMVQECEINSAMRNEQGSTATDRTYYPERSQSIPSDYAFFNNDVEEAFDQNKGYNEVVSIMSQFGDDPFLPFKGKRHPVRIMYSEPYVNDQFKDGYLQWLLGSYKDFDHRLGEMVHIGVHRSSLYSVQERGVNYHYVNDRALLSDDASEGQLLLGSGDVLSQKTLNISDEIGSMSQFSILETERAVYGYDFQKRAIWRLSGKEFGLLDVNKSFHADVMAISEIISDHSDIIHAIPDNPVCNAGVTCFWDRKHGELGWTFLIPNGSTRITETLVFSEQLDAYMGKRSHYSPFYIKLNEDLFSMDPGGAPWVGADQYGDFYLHDSDNVGRMNFYDVQFQGMISLLSNERSAGPKVFDALKLAVNGLDLHHIDFITEYQTSPLTPFLPQPVYLRSLYKENRWHIPVPKAAAIIGTQSEYQVGSPMRGKWMRMDMWWETDQEVEIRSLLTHFRPSVQ